jgi:hypothetical protein
MRSFNINLGFDRFKFVYWVIAIATAQHTAWGAATTMQGALPDASTLQLGWWLQGAFFAIAVDYSMVMIATKIRSGTSAARTMRLWKIAIPLNWYTIAFVVVAILSSYFQLLYAWAHATPLESAGGISAEWIARLQSLIDARIAIAPFALPSIAILYTFGGFGKGGEAQSKARNVATPTQSMQSPRTVDTISVEREVAELSAGSQLRQLPGPTQRRDGEVLLGYVCPGCNKELSISGWSRHKRTCPKYVAMISNGHAKVEVGE